jgi:hypothetical protein
MAKRYHANRPAVNRRESGLAPVRLGRLLALRVRLGVAALTTAESGKLCTNRGAGGDIELTLPAARAGLEYVFCVVEDAKYVKAVAAAGNTVRIGGSVSVAGGYARSSTAGNTILLVGLNSTEWVAPAKEGTWSVDS